MKISRNPLRIVSRFHILPECSAHKYHFVVNSGYMLIFMASSENVCILKTIYYYAIFSNVHGIKIVFK